MGRINTTKSGVVQVAVLMSLLCLGVVVQSAPVSKSVHKRTSEPHTYVESQPGGGGSQYYRYHSSSSSSSSGYPSGQQGSSGDTGSSGGRYYHYSSSSSSNGPSGQSSGQVTSLEGLTVDDLVRQGIDRQRAEEIINHFRNAGGSGSISYHYSKSSSSSSSSNRGQHQGQQGGNYGTRITAEDLVRQGYDRQTAEEMVRNIEAGRDYQSSHGNTDNRFSSGNSGSSGNAGSNGGHYYHYSSSSSSSGPSGPNNGQVTSLEGLTVDDLVRQGVDRQRAEEIINHIRNFGGSGSISYQYSSSKSSSSSSSSSNRGGRNSQYSQYSGPSKVKRGTGYSNLETLAKNSKRINTEKVKRSSALKSLNPLEKFRRSGLFAFLQKKSVNSESEKMKRGGTVDSEKLVSKAKRTIAMAPHVQSGTVTRRGQGKKLARESRDYFVPSLYANPYNSGSNSQSQPWSDPYYRSPYEDRSRERDSYNSYKNHAYDDDDDYYYDDDYHKY